MPSGKTASATLVRFRRDLLLSDPPAFHQACETGPVIPLYIHDPEGEADRP
jgi:deoxyribodipyrimidine photo-lyase